MTILHVSLFDRAISRKRPGWVILLASLVLFLLPFGIAYLDGTLESILHQGLWRVLVLPSAVILYIFLISPVMQRVGDDVIRSIQPYTSLDVESYAAVINSTLKINPMFEIFFLIIGFILGILSAQASGFDQGMSLLKVYWYVASGLMYGLLLWTIFAAVASTRVNSVMLRLPLNIDLSTQAPFETVGRQSLLLALVFVGGITISIIFSLRREDILSPAVWAGYLALILVTVLIFFLSMYPTHRVLAGVKQAELERVEKQIYKTYREMLTRLEENQSIEEIPTQINTLTLYEQRLHGMRSWPYNTAMLRTLFFSVIVPLATFLARRIGEIMFAP
jgi:hypothetical protein